MKIIGHRGAAGLALENTVESIEAAVRAGVDAIEFDIRVTRDKQLILIHDRHTKRVSDEALRVQKQTLTSLRGSRLLNGQPPASLQEAIKAAKRTPLIIEGKEGGWAIPLATFLKKNKPLPTCSVASFNLKELSKFRKLMPKIPAYALERTKPFDVIQSANTLGLNGIDINFWLLNPLTYILARRRKLDIIVYTVNSPFLAQFLRMLYPNISITTDVPNRLQFLRSSQHQTDHKSRI